jgi:hypothetical protein
MNEGKAQLLLTWVVGPDKAAEMDRLETSHGAWMAKTDHGDGPTALLSYNLSKGPELTNGKPGCRIGGMVVSVVPSG